VNDVRWLAFALLAWLALRALVTACERLR